MADKPTHDSVYDAEPLSPSTAPTLASLPGQETPFRPTTRPTIAFLTVCDDGSSDGEVIRIRGGKFVIGRVEGDLLIPHDDQISGRHVEILRDSVAGRHHWSVIDRGSTNGLFVRVRRTTLNNMTEFLVGRGRYRYEGGGGDLMPGAGGETLMWAAGALPDPSVVEVLPDGSGKRYVLKKPECWIGAEPGCDIRRPADSFVALRHVRLYRDAKGTWHAQNNQSVNGLWVRASRIDVDEGACSFQIGEQRFRLNIGT